MASEASVLGLKRLAVEDEPVSLKRARAVAEEPEEDLSTVDSFLDRLVFGVRASSTSSDARSFAESQLRPVLAKTQRQTEATRVLFKALQNLQTKLCRQQEAAAGETDKLKGDLKISQDRASAAERQVETLVWQLRSLGRPQPMFGNSRGSFPGPDPGVF